MGGSPELLWAKNSSLIHLFHIIFLDFFCKTAYTVYVLHIQLSDQIFKENLIFSFPFPTSFYGILYPVLKQYAPGHGGRQAVPRLFFRAPGPCIRSLQPWNVPRPLGAGVFRVIPGAAVLPPPRPIVR